VPGHTEDSDVTRCYVETEFGACSTAPFPAAPCRSSMSAPGPVPVIPAANRGGAAQNLREVWEGTGSCCIVQSCVYVMPTWPDALDDAAKGFP